MKTKIPLEINLSDILLVVYNEEGGGFVRSHIKDYLSSGDVSAIELDRTIASLEELKNENELE